MEASEIAEKARSLAVMVRVQGPDPKGLKMRGHAFHQRENGITTLSASGHLLSPSLKDALPLLSDKSGMGAVVVTTASVVEPFLPAQYRALGHNYPAAVQAAVPKLIPGACVNVLLERDRSESGLDEPRRSPGWLQAQLLAIVDVAVASAALQSLVGSYSGSTDYNSWEVGWMLSPLLDSGLKEMLKQMRDSCLGRLSSCSYLLVTAFNAHQMAEICQVSHSCLGGTIWTGYLKETQEYHNLSPSSSKHLSIENDGTSQRLGAASVYDHILSGALGE